MTRGRPRNNEYLRAEFGRRVNVLRRKTDLEIRELARRVRVDPGTMGGILKGVRNCKPDRRRFILMTVGAERNDYLDFGCGPPGDVSSKDRKSEEELERGRALLGQSNFKEAEEIFDRVFLNDGHGHLARANAARLKAWLLFERAQYADAEQEVSLCLSLLAQSVGAGGNDLTPEDGALGTLRPASVIAAECSQGALPEGWVLNQALHILTKVLIARELSAWSSSGAQDYKPSITAALELHVDLSRRLSDHHHHAHILLWQAILETHRFNDVGARRALAQMSDFRLGVLGRAYHSRAKGIHNAFLLRPKKALDEFREAAQGFADMGDARALGPTLSRIALLEPPTTRFRFALAAAAVHPYGSICREFSNLVFSRDIRARSQFGSEAEKLVAGRIYPFDLVHRVMRGTINNIEARIHDNLGFLRGKV